ncbi:MAG: hypothetical protein HDR23_10180 [Lachnospiraceae bacterium]|nr:hypothetical protein [Lachnospiraceae bacterium]
MVYRILGAYFEDDCADELTNYPVLTAILGKEVLASDIEDRLLNLTKDYKVPYVVSYGEFMYQAGSWDYLRRVICKVENPADQIMHMFTFIVTKMVLILQQ